MMVPRGLLVRLLPSCKLSNADCAARRGWRTWFRTRTPIPPVSRIHAEVSSTRRLLSVARRESTSTGYAVTQWVDAEPAAWSSSTPVHDVYNVLITATSAKTTAQKFEDSSCAALVPLIRKHRWNGQEANHSNPSSGGYKYFRMAYLWCYSCGCPFSIRGQYS